MGGSLKADDKEWRILYGTLRCLFLSIDLIQQTTTSINNKGDSTNHRHPTINNNNTQTCVWRSEPVTMLPTALTTGVNMHTSEQLNRSISFPTAPSKEQQKK